MSTEDTRDSGREVAPASSEPRTEPVREAPTISDADRAANPLGAARREREMHRDDHGKFAPKPDGDKQDGGKQAKPEGKDGGDKPTDQDPPDRQQPGQVPHQALAAERGKRQAAMDENAALRRELAELRGMVMGRQQQPAPQPQQPTPPPEFWQDPNAAMEYRLKQAMSPVEQQLQQHRLGTSQMLAMQQHGPEAVQSAVQALAELRQTNPTEYQRLEALAERSFDPVGDVVRWHKQTNALREIGNDPAAYRERLRQELLAELQQGGGDPQQHAPPAAQRPPVQPGPLPSSFAAQRGGGPRGGPAYGGPRPLDQIMGR